MNEADQLRANKARFDLYQAMQYRWHDYLEGHLARYAKDAQIDGLEAEVKAVGAEIKRLVEKLRDAGPEFLYEERKRRRHKT